MTLKLITTPSVYLVGRQTVVQEEVDRFLADHEVSWQTDTEVGGEAISETAGRICYMSFARPRPGGNAAYLENIKASGHGSVLEHAAWNFVLTGISRTCSHELVRHRQGVAYSQLSQRYVDESVAEYVVPPDLQEEVALARCWEEANLSGAVGSAFESVHCRLIQERLGRERREGDQEKTNVGLVWIEAMKYAHESYKELADYLTSKARKERPDLSKTDARKYARQAARSVLPNATETKVYFTANVRALRHILEMRVSRHAEPEIRILFGKVWEVMREESPNFFSDYEKVLLPDGTFELSTKYRKV